MTTEIDVKPTREEITRHKSRVELSRERLDASVEKVRELRDEKIDLFNMSSQIEQVFNTLEEVKLYQAELENYIGLLEARLKHFDETIVI